MKVEKFVEKYLPDAERKWREYYKNYSCINESVEFELDYHEDESFIKHYFQEAYENAMKAQREICSKNIPYEYALNRDSVYNAPMP